MSSVVIYTTRFCPYCVRAKNLLKEKGIRYSEIGVDGDSERREEMTSRSGRRTVPQIWVGETHIGGCDDLMRLERAGRLDHLLQA